MAIEDDVRRLREMLERLSRSVEEMRRDQAGQYGRINDQLKQIQQKVAGIK